MLFTRRKRLEALEKREAAGETFWSPEFDEPFRIKMIHLVQEVVEHNDPRGTYAHARMLILKDEGKFYLSDSNQTQSQDFCRYLMTCKSEEVPTCIEALYESLSVQAAAMYVWSAPRKFAEGCATILREHRISYDLVEGMMVQFSSRELHESVVAPTVSLLAGRKGFETVERAYGAALEEISAGKPADAITDVATALQETLGILGCSGNSLGPLIRSAKSKGLLLSHDAPMLDAVTKVMDWVSADRSTLGDAHVVAEPSIDDAWFIVHVTGAVILRIAQSSNRGESNSRS